eukprot:tig00021589_g22741.t1
MRTQRGSLALPSVFCVSPSSESPLEKFVSFGRRQIVPRLADLRLAIAELVLIAACSSLGTIITQEQAADFYVQNFPESPALYGFLTWKVVLGAGLDHVYSTWWFLGLLILFGSSLTACSFTTQLPALKLARKWKYYTRPEQFRRLDPLAARIENGAKEDLAAALQKRGYEVHQEGSVLYGTKGVIGKVAPIFVHISMLLVLAGAIGGSVFGWMAQELIPAGLDFTIDNIVSAGPLAEGRLPNGLIMRANRFWIDYADDGRVDQFHSIISALDKDGKEVRQEEIHVNKPMRYQGMTFYQTSWSLYGIVVKLNNSPDLLIPMARLEALGKKAEVWGGFLPTKPDMSEGYPIVAKDMINIFVYNKDGSMNSVIRPGMNLELDGINVQFKEMIGATGLQIKDDPGIPLVYAGFGFLMLSSAASFIAHNQVWALEDEQGILHMGARSNRAPLTLEEQLDEVVEEVKESAKGRRSRKTNTSNP